MYHGWFHVMSAVLSWLFYLRGNFRLFPPSAFCHLFYPKSMVFSRGSFWVSKIGHSQQQWFKGWYHISISSSPPILNVEFITSFYHIFCMLSDLFPDIPYFHQIFQRFFHRLLCLCRCFFVGFPCQDVLAKHCGTLLDYFDEAWISGALKK